MNLLITTVFGAAGVLLLASATRRREARQRATRALQHTAELRRGLVNDVEQLLRLEKAEILM